MKLFRSIILLFLLAFTLSARAQFAPAASEYESPAISKDSSVFVEWADGCNIQRGYRDIAFPDSGYASVGDANSAIGKAGQNGVVSLGDSGIATLTFQSPIYNGPGFDFAVFENGFYTATPLAFLEFAFVEVSSDGNNYYRFPVTSNVQDTVQIPMGGIDCSLVNNLAGKYVFGYGTPFDLDELKNEAGLDVNNVTHVRLIDVVGSINNQFATHDQFGHRINDPYPTPFASGGFDLDAVGVIHSTGISSIDKLQVPALKFQIYPNPLFGNDVRLNISQEFVGSKMKVFDVSGRIVDEEQIESQYTILNTKYYSKGVYFITIGSQTSKFLIE